MAMIYENVPQVFARWQAALQKAQNINLQLRITANAIEILRGNNVFYSSDDLEIIHIVLDAYEQALQAVSPP